MEAMFSQRAFHPFGGDVLHCIGVAVEGVIGIRIVAAELLAKLEETVLGFLLDLLEVFIGDQAISCLAHLINGAEPWSYLGADIANSVVEVLASTYLLGDFL